MALVDTDTGVKVADLTPDEARHLTERIRSTAEVVWSLLLEAHDRGAYAAMGYRCWRDYATAEFGMSQSHAYRLLDQARVVAEIEEVAGSPMGEIVSERAARDIKPRLTDVTKAIKEKVTAEATAPEPERVKEIVAEVVAEEREKAKKQAEDAEVLADLTERAKGAGMDMDKVSLAERGTWSTHCRELPDAGEPAEFIARHRQHLTARHIAQAERAYAWLDTFLLELGGIHERPRGTPRVRRRSARDGAEDHRRADRRVRLPPPR